MNYFVLDKTLVPSSLRLGPFPPSYAITQASILLLVLGGVPGGVIARLSPGIVHVRRHVPARLLHPAAAAAAATTTAAAVSATAKRFRMNERRSGSGAERGRIVFGASACAHANKRRTRHMHARTHRAAGERIYSIKLKNR